LLELAIAQRENGQFQESLATLEQAESQYGLDCWIADNRARVCLALGENRMAEEHWRVAMEHSTSQEIRDSFERMLHYASEVTPTITEVVESERACETVIDEMSEQRELTVPTATVNLENGVTLEYGIIGSRPWLLATDPFDDAILEFGVDHKASEASIQWYARPDAFIYQTLKNINLLPNPGFQAHDGKSLEGWLPDATDSCAVDVDFSDQFKLGDGHTVYLYAPAGAPRPGLRLKQPVAIRSDMGWGYRFTAFISIHRGTGEFEAEFLDADGNTQGRESLILSQTDQHPGGAHLSDYQWVEWLLHPPRGAEYVNLHLYLGEHNGQHHGDSFLFLTLPFLGIAAEKPQAWGPECPSAGQLLTAVRDERWKRFGTIELPRDAKSVQFLGQTFDLQHRGAGMAGLSLARRRQCSCRSPQWTGDGQGWRTVEPTGIPCGGVAWTESAAQQ